jgi:hypothetical protein
MRGQKGPRDSREEAKNRKAPSPWGLPGGEAPSIPEENSAGAKTPQFYIFFNVNCPVLDR